MNNAEVHKLVNDFETAASQPNHDFSAVYQDFRNLQETAPDLRTYSQEVLAANQALMAAGAIPESQYPGMPDFVIMGADSEGHIITADPLRQNIQYRDQHMLAVGYQPLSSATPFIPQDFCQNAPKEAPQHNAPTDQPQAGPTPGQALQEIWGGKSFEVQADGSARYTVVHGDTVWAVAKAYLMGHGQGNPSDTAVANEVNVIAKASNLSNPNLIYPGNELVVPGSGGVQQTDSQPVTGYEPPPPQHQPVSPPEQPSQPAPPAPSGSKLQQEQAIGLDANNPVDKIVYMLSESEGGPQSINWNDVGQGISVGMYQANQKGGPLATLFQAMQQADPGDFNRIFGADADKLTNQSQLNALQFSPDNQLGHELEQALAVPALAHVELTEDRTRVEGFAKQAEQNYGVTSPEGIALFTYMMNWGPALAEKYFAAAANVNGQPQKIQAVLDAASKAGDSQAVSRINATIARANQLQLSDTATFTA